MSDKIKYYNPQKILSIDAYYYMIIGERSNGKTFAFLDIGLKSYVEKGHQFAYVRRWQDDFKGLRGKELMKSLICDGNGKNRVEIYTKGEWNDIVYESRAWYLARYDKEMGRMIKDNNPFAFAFAISSGEHDKSVSFPMVRMIMFDELLTRKSYLPNEFVEFMNIISTIVRLRNDVKVIMLGNTISTSCPYFAEMGLKNIKKMKPNDIDVYTYGDTELKVAVEFADMPKKNKKSNVYFAFDNPKLSMIRGDGSIWEIGMYPHLPQKYTYEDVIFVYFIIYDEETLQCEIIDGGNGYFTYIHRKTTPIQNDDDIIFKTEYDIRYNVFRKINRPLTEMHRKIWSFFENDKVFYQDNEVGEIVRNYVNWCDTSELEEI